MSTNNNINKKLSTGIAGLDAIFHGGIHTHDNEGDNKGIVMLARGQHGVNKIHLAMQICEGLNESLNNHDVSDILSNRYEMLIKYNKIKKNSNKIITCFENVISGYSTDDEKQAAEIEQWKSRKAEFESNYWQWFLGIAPKLNSIEKSQQICNKSVKEWVEYYNVNYLNASDSDLFGEEITESFLRKLYEGGEKMDCPKLLFISLNKDDYLLKNSYYDFYIQRLIRDIRMGVDSDRVSRSLLLLHSMLWTESKSKIDNNAILTGYSFPSVTGKKTSVSAINRFKKDIQTGFIYYNGRTHSLHVRHQKGAEDSGGMLLCRLGIPDDYDVRIIGKDSLIGDDKSADGLTTFQEMMRELEKYKDKNIPQETQPKNNAEKLEVDFIMVDGLSRLNEDELAQCPLNALSDRLRSKSQVAIITADKKLSPSEISTDIVLDMEILPSERPDHQYTALKVSKCLYQKNAYGWHRYKMRNAGIEVIPSIHLQMGQRFLMDDIVTDAVLPINEYPYPFWLNENNDIYEDKVISKARGKYENSQKELLELVGHFEGRFLEKREVKEFLEEMLRKSKEKKHHVLFVNLDMNRIEVYNNYINDYFQVNNNRIDPKKIHLFNFQPGYIHTDEMLWAIDQQIRAIENVARRHIGTEKGRGLSTHYTHVRLIFGDLNYIHYAYPCLSAESLLLPALATYTKKHHMTNYVYATVNEGKHVEYTDLHKKEIETIMQMRRITKPFDEPLEKINVFEKK